MFKALVLTEGDGAVSSEIKDLDETELPDGDVTLATEYSTLNYKDGMIVNGIGRLVRQFPHVPGVDLAGTVETSDHPEFEAGGKVGDAVTSGGQTIGIGFAGPGEQGPCRRGRGAVFGQPRPEGHLLRFLVEVPWGAGPASRLGDHPR